MSTILDMRVVTFRQYPHFRRYDICVDVDQINLIINIIFFYYSPSKYELCRSGAVNKLIYLFK